MRSQTVPLIFCVLVGAITCGSKAHAKAPKGLAWAQLGMEHSVIVVTTLHIDEQEGLNHALDSGVLDGDAERALLSARASVVPFRYRKHKTWVVATPRGPLPLSLKGFRVAHGEETMRLEIVLDGVALEDVGAGPAQPLRTWKKAGEPRRVMTALDVYTPNDEDLDRLWKAARSRVGKTLRARLLKANFDSRALVLVRGDFGAQDAPLAVASVALTEGEGENADASHLVGVLQVDRERRVLGLPWPLQAGRHTLAPLATVSMAPGDASWLIVERRSDSGCWISALIPEAKDWHVHDLGPAACYSPKGVNREE